MLISCILRRVVPKCTWITSKIIKTRCLRVSRFLHFLQLLCHKNAPNQSLMFKKHKTTQIRTKKIWNFWIFSIFSEYFFQNEFNLYALIVHYCTRLTFFDPRSVCRILTAEYLFLRFTMIIQNCLKFSNIELKTGLH
jgi:hypothetical protein